VCSFFCGGARSINGEKRRKTEKNGEKRRKTEKNGEKRRKTEKNGEKRRKTEKNDERRNTKPKASLGARHNLYSEIRGEGGWVRRRRVRREDGERGETARQLDAV